MRVLTCPCCDGICGPQSGCNCGPCQKLDREEAEREFESGQSSTPPSSSLLEGWRWGPQPQESDLRKCLDALVREQRLMCLDAASTTLSASRLQQRFMVAHRSDTEAPVTIKDVSYYLASIPNIKADSIMFVTRLFVCLILVLHV